MKPGYGNRVEVESVDEVVVTVGIDTVGGACWYLHEGPKYLGRRSSGINRVQISPVGCEASVVTSTKQRTNFSEEFNGLERRSNQ